MDIKDMTAEQIEAIEKAAIESAVNMGKPETAWDEEGNLLVVNGNPTSRLRAMYRWFDRDKKP